MTILPLTPQQHAEPEIRPRPAGWCYRCALPSDRCSPYHLCRAQPDTLAGTAERMACRFTIAERFPDNISDWGPGEAAIARAVAEELLLWARRIEFRLASRQ